MVNASQKSLPRCTFAGGKEDGAFTDEQRKYPIKMRWRICARCGLHRREHRHSRDSNAKATDAVVDAEAEHHLPPHKRPALRRWWVEEEQQPEERDTWSADAIVATGKRAPRKKRANAP